MLIAQVGVYDIGGGGGGGRVPYFRGPFLFQGILIHIRVPYYGKAK